MRNDQNPMNDMSRYVVIRLHHPIEVVVGAFDGTLHIPCEPPAVWFDYTPDRKGTHPQTHLANFKDILQADAFAGFNALFETGDIKEAAC
jgi:hypothetical protein